MALNGKSSSRAELLTSGAAVHGGILIAALMLVAAGMSVSQWPWYLLLPLVIYGTVVLAVPFLRRTAPRLCLGRIGGGPLVFAVAVATGAAAVLVGFHEMERPELALLGKKIPVGAFGSLILAGVCFSVVNALLEELIFRGVLWEVVSQEWNQITALGVTSALFGLGHLEGYPPGPFGAILAGVYGLVLGVLRWWTGGLGLALACHISADATIFSLLASSGAFPE